MILIGPFRLITENKELISRVFSSQFIIPDFKSFCSSLKQECCSLAPSYTLIYTQIQRNSLPPLVGNLKSSMKNVKLLTRARMQLIFHNQQGLILNYFQSQSAQSTDKDSHWAIKIQVIRYSPPVSQGFSLFLALIYLVTHG